MKIESDNGAFKSLHAQKSIKKQKEQGAEFFYDDLPNNITAHFKDIENDIKKYKIFMSDNRIFIRRKKNKKTILTIISKYRILKSKFYSIFKMKSSPSNY